jgi:hypothetical protein
MSRRVQTVRQLSMVSACESRPPCSSKQYKAVAFQPMPRGCVQHERENAFID